MLYGDRSVKGNSAERKEAVAQDLEYLQGMYPIHMKRLQEYVISACDHLDYRNSPCMMNFRTAYWSTRSVIPYAPKSLRMAL